MSHDSNPPPSNKETNGVVMLIVLRSWVYLNDGGKAKHNGIEELEASSVFVLHDNRKTFRVSQTLAIHRPKLAHRSTSEFLEHPLMVLPVLHPLVELTNRAFTIAGLNPI